MCGLTYDTNYFSASIWVTIIDALLANTITIDRSHTATITLLFGKIGITISNVTERLLKLVDYLPIIYAKSLGLFCLVYRGLVQYRAT